MDSLNGTTSYQWDERGNLVQKASPAETTTYGWTVDNRLAKVSTGAKTVEYGYDSSGRRIKRLVKEGATTTETHYKVDHQRNYSEILVESTKVNSGAWVDTVHVHTPDGVGELIASTTAGAQTQLFSDGLGSVRVGQTAATSHAFSYDAFGIALGATEGMPANAADAAATSHRYTGEYADSQTGLLHLRARDYDPQVGRFISMDEHPGKESIPLTLNKYIYVNADPVNHIDPSGNFFTIAGTMTSVGRQMNIVRLAFINGGRQAGGAAIRNLGQLVERRIEGMIRQCLKPGVDLKKGWRTGDGKVTVDFFFEMGKKTKAMEVKYSLGSASSEAFARAARQLKSALKKTDDVVLVSFKEISQRHQKSMLDKLGNPGVAPQMGAMVELAAMLGEFVIEGCIR